MILSIKWKRLNEHSLKKIKPRIQVMSFKCMLSKKYLISQISGEWLFLSTAQ